MDDSFGILAPYMKKKIQPDLCFLDLAKILNLYPSYLLKTSFSRKFLHLLLSTMFILKLLTEGSILCLKHKRANSFNFRPPLQIAIF